MSTEMQTSSKAINKNIYAIRKAYQSANEKVHETLVMIAKHSLAYNDCSGLTRLLQALPAGIARASSVIIATMNDYTPIVVDVKGDSFNARFAKKDSQHDKPFDIEGLEANPWYNRPEAQKDPTILSLDDYGDKLLKMADGILRKIKKDEVVNADKAALADLAAKLKVFAKTVVPSTIPTTMQPVNSNEATEAEANAA